MARSHCPAAPFRSLIVLLGMLGWALVAPASGQPAAPAPPPAAAACLKLVFNRFCLGGDVNSLLQREAPAARVDDGERLALNYYDGPEALYVLAWRGRIYKVVRRYRMASQLRFEELYRVLIDKYGAGEDQSRFPPGADSAGRRHIAIRRGEGFALHRWQVPEGWHIELGWTRELGLSLAYIADALDAQQTAATASGF